MPRTQLISIPAHGKGVLGDYGIEMSVQCLECKHLRPRQPVTCKAFESGIPAKVLNGKHDHRKPYKGDKGIRFEKIG